MESSLEWGSLSSVFSFCSLQCSVCITVHARSVVFCSIAFFCRIEARPQFFAIPRVRRAVGTNRIFSLFFACLRSRPDLIPLPFCMNNGSEKVKIRWISKCFLFLSSTLLGRFFVTEANLRPILPSLFLGHIYEKELYIWWLTIQLRIFIRNPKIVWFLKGFFISKKLPLRPCVFAGGLILRPFCPFFLLYTLVE